MDIMKLIDLMHKVDKSSANETYINYDTLFNVFNICYNDINDTKTNLKAFWLARWRCGNEYVGFIVYFLDYELVGISYQYYRKDDIKYEFVSDKMANRVREYLNSIVIAKGYSLLSEEDKNAELGNGFSINYNSNILNDYVIYKNTGEFVKVKNNRLPDSTQIEITDNNNNTKIVNLQEIEVPWRISTL